MCNMRAKILCISYLDTPYSRSSVYLENLESTELTKEFLQISLPSLVAFKKLWANRRTLRDKSTVILVMNPCHVFVPFIKLLSSQPIILDAGWPLSDSILNKPSLIVNKIAFLKNYVIDYFAFRSASLILLESQKQIDYSATTFRIRRNKLIRLYTGFNENVCSSNSKSAREKFLSELGLDSKTKYIFFRGKYTKECGMEIIAKLSKSYLSHIQFIIATNKNPEKLEFGDNVKILTNYLSEAQIESLYVGSSVCLGQLSNYQRLDRTIPHKAFEAGYFGRPYVTLDTESIRELYPKDNQVSYIENLSLNLIAATITSIFDDKTLVKNLSKNIKEQYNKVAQQRILQGEFVRIALNLLQVFE